MARKTPIRIGTQFRYHHADSNALWTVKAKRGRDTFDCVIESDPDYAGTKKVFGGEEIRSAIVTVAAWDSMAKAQDKWFAKLKLGAIYHYHNGFGEYVRCRVIRENGENLFAPIALVGTWNSHDLPRRNQDGTIYYPHHAAKVVNRIGAWQPSVTCIFEHPEFVRNHRHEDPRQMVAIDLTVPEMADDQRELARLEKLRLDMIKTLNQRSTTKQDYERAFEEVEALLDTVNTKATV